jgi:HD-GYP domain-containing protein (c-di-GMP phosphodiesterase class II)
MSRVITILDAFDVMTNPQQVKPAMTTEEALQELRLKAGSQYDPSLAQSFIQMMNENKA